MILAGDIGGTKTLLALFEVVDGQWQQVCVREYASQNYVSLESILDEFLAIEISTPHTASVEAACFGIAGPIVQQKSKLTNLSWTIDGAALQTYLKTEQVRLLNDLEVIGHSLPWLGADELLTLSPGNAENPKSVQPGNIVILAAGTGLGESLLFWDGFSHHPSASEGGHTDFAPRNAWEIGLLQFLMHRFDGHVSYERILSGPGFVDLLDYVVSHGVEPTESVAHARAHLSNPVPVISDAGLNRTCLACSEVMDHFVSIYGAEAGNLALKGLALGGVYLGGGIAPRIRARLQEGGFMEAFLDKGRFRGLLQTMPVNIILNPEAGLLGAARYATLLTEAARAAERSAE